MISHSTSFVNSFFKDIAAVCQQQAGQEAPGQLTRMSYRIYFRQGGRADTPSHLIIDMQDHRKLPPKQPQKHIF